MVLNYNLDTYGTLSQPRAVARGERDERENFIY